MKYLRARAPEDLDLMYIIENDLKLTQYSSTTVLLSRYALKQYIAESSGDLYRDSQVRMTIIDAASNTACGFLDLTDLSAVHRRAQVGIVLMEDARGRGIATLALNEATAYAREQGLHQLYAVVASCNHLACNLFLRSGYIQVSTLPQWLYVNGKYVDATLFQIILSD